MRIACVKARFCLLCSSLSCIRQREASGSEHFVMGGVNTARQIKLGCTQFSSADGVE